MIYKNKFWTLAKERLKKVQTPQVNLKNKHAFYDIDNSKYVFCKKKIDSYFRSVISDQKRRDQFEKRELTNVVLKSILMSERVSLKKRHSSFRRLVLVRSIFRKRTKASGTITRVRNRCIITGRSSIVGHTGLSRITFRRYAGLGKIPGLLKY